MTKTKQDDCWLYNRRQSGSRVPEVLPERRFRFCLVGRAVAIFS